MTIAACYLSSEGVVFGADSTTTMFVAGRGPNATGSEHHYNYAQKIFQIGQNSTLAMTMWGLGNLGETSYRTLIAQYDKTPSAFEIQYNPMLTAPKPVDQLPIGTPKFWGCPNLVDRLLYGIDWEVLDDIERSEEWTGTKEKLFELITPHCLGQPQDLPIREAIDWIHASVYTTIKARKFSHLPSVCGGPVEMAVITTDRPFRWVRHKKFDSAISQGDLNDV